MRLLVTFGTVLVCLVFAGAGCVSGTTGNQELTQDHVSKIEKGVTTRQQVVEILGEPESTQLLGDGRRTMFYIGTQSKSDVGQRVFQGVPIIGAVVPTTDTQSVRRETLQIILNGSDIVQDYEFSDNTSETKTTTSMFGGHVETVTTPNDSTQPSSSGGNK
jgi:outer membrane protein assembly factor BamE (lipoprotein component of BamABCDE complex)